MMMALKLDAICAKLKLNHTSVESRNFTSENNNDSKSPELTSSIGRSPTLQSDHSDTRQDFTDESKVSSLSLLSADASLENVGRDADVSADLSASSTVGRRNRRKNFQPRCIQEVSSSDKSSEKIAPISAEEFGDKTRGQVVGDYGHRSHDETNNELEVLDLRVGDPSHEEVEILNGRSSPIVDEGEMFVDNCGVIDLSMNRKTDDDLTVKTSAVNGFEKKKSRSKITTSQDAFENPLSKRPPPPPSNCLDKCSGDDVVPPINDFALQTMNRLLKIYGLSEENDPDSHRRGIPFPVKTSTDDLWSSDLTDSMTSSAIPDASKQSFLPSDDLDMMTKSSASPSSSQSMETSTNASMDEDSSLPVLVKNLNKHALISSFAGFSGKFSLPKRLNSKHCLPDYNAYAKRCSSFEECSNATCRERGYREHFHCTACTSRVFQKKEEMIRHFKWHKKREDSLQHGFMRYSPLDDCSKRFSSNCGHNGKHTHYHCLQTGCSKVYISTSDVQMHANYHRKDSAIIQEGFQRFRATENCSLASCVFAGQKTTHFHCCRPGCNFTFKNKADMEKHKTYHQKDEILSRDGFKKFMKYEQCHFLGCHYSRVSNHIHCIRPDCSYVLHSTGQLYSHKRKHERREMERSVYKQLGSAAGSLTADTNNTGSSSVSEGLWSGRTTVVQPVVLSTAVNMSGNTNRSNDSESDDVSESQNIELTNNQSKEIVKNEFLEEKNAQECVFSGGFVKLAADLAGKSLGDSLNLPIPFAPLPEANGNSDDDDDDDEELEELSSVPAKFMPSVLLLPKVLPPVNEKKERDESWKKYLTRYTANDPCHAQCQFLYKDHYHCNEVDCGWLFRSKDGVREHAKFHEQQDRLTALTFMKYDAETKCTEGCEHSEKLLHYHCLWTNCDHVISSKDSVFSRLEHHKLHDSLSRKTTGLTSASGFDSLRRKRGRPPKFPKNDIPVIPKVEMTEEEIQTQAELTGSNSPIANGFQRYEPGQACPDDQCIYARTEHYHCVRPRCHHVTDRSNVLALHAKDFHSFVAIADGFEFFDRNVNCRRPHCHNNQSNRHFHCVRPHCDYSFVRYSTMVQHDRKHHAKDRQTGESFNLKPDSKINLATPSLFSSASATVSKASSTTALLPVSSLLAGAVDASVFLSQASVGLGPVLLTSLQPLSSGLTGQTVSPIVVGAIKQGLQISSHDLQLTSSPLKLVSIAPKPIVKFQLPTTSGVVTPSDAKEEAPLTMLLQQKTSAVPLVDWVSMKLKMHHRIHQNCGRPFCKLKKKDHYHCFDCNQAFSDPSRLKSHVSRHGFAVDNAQRVRDQVQNGTPQEERLSVDEERVTISKMEDGADAGLEHPEEHSSGDVLQREIPDKSEHQAIGNHLDECDEMDDVDAGRLVIDLSSVRPGSDDGVIAGSSIFGSSTPIDGGSHSTKFGLKREFDEELCEPKKAKLTPGGYEKFRFSDDCCQDRCAYRLSMTHYHCSRTDCGYSFCDHSRFLQHSDRHQRIDAIMGDQFQHFHAKTDCRHAGCEHSRTATHFHCLLCPFICTDSSKVVAHRKHHTKMDRITENGFRKFGVGEDCEFVTCLHRSKQTHYHCSHPNCGQVVMGPAQMGLHKAKHTNIEKSSASAIVGDVID